MLPFLVYLIICEIGTIYPKHNLEAISFNNGANYVTIDQRRNRIGG